MELDRFLARKFLLKSQSERHLSSTIQACPVYKLWSKTGQIALFYISTSVWVLCTSNAGQNMCFQCFYATKLKKFSGSYQKFLP